MSILYWVENCQSPLTQGWRYRSACDLKARFPESGESGKTLSRQCYRGTKWISWLQTQTRRLGETLQTLFQPVSLLPASSAECDRGFSCMNANDTGERNQLSVETLSASLFLKMNGPPPSLFNPTPYVELWPKEGRHSSTDTPTGKASNCKDTLHWHR